jgi:hypothetical protein
MEELKELEAQSRRIRKLRNLVFYMFIGFPFIGLGVMWISRKIFSTEVVLLPLLFAYMLAYLILGHKVSNVYCPVCHGSMFRKGILYGMGFRCVHCDYDLKNYKSSKFHK